MDETQPSPVLTDLTEVERQVVETARRGDLADSATMMTVEELAVTDNPELRVRADLLRDLLRGLHGDLDPRGIRLAGVRVIGELDLDHVTAVTGLDLYESALPDGIVCRHAHLRDLYLNRCLLSYLHADGLRTDSHLFIRDATITGGGDVGAIRLPSAQISGQLGLDRITITNTTGPALHADGLRTGYGIFMDDATITSAGDLGAIRLPGAQISGPLSLDRITITNTTGPALYADGLRTDSDLFIKDATITGAGKLGAIRLAGAQIGGQTALLVSRLDSSSGPLLVMHEAQITGALLLLPAVVCPTSRQTTSRRGCPDGDRTIIAHGLTYPVLRETSWRQWLHLLVHHTPAYWPQPFQQLAATERAAGHDNNAREVLITQQNDLRRRTPEALGNRIAQWRHGIWGWLGRYGYRAHRLVTALAVVLTLAAALSLLAGHVTTHPGHHAAERVPPATAKPVTPGTPCSPVELIGLGIDRGLPLGTTGIRAHCDLDTTTGWGQTFTAILWALQALLWGLATLAIAAYTGLVRKPT
ncbi:hypothetical protein SAMN05421837_10547 [Amycolatopsis pretoriensis]|uniref:Oxidoreductase n=1 Tax=Amycolatopsis pretoriensis TaxID=218821 RepID=A0A1H5QXX0_9PSEU|nr:hypothetical protein [Amycolatopsis pretoriensis]SEF30188.1 hypothetical protein SAMN05421837_10547 [Amycolatopsis pretoriensis]